MSARNKQNWIKDILSKSGTELTTINEDKSEGWLPTFCSPQKKDIFLVVLKCLVFFFCRLPQRNKKATDL